MAVSYCLPFLSRDSESKLRDDGCVSLLPIPESKLVDDGYVSLPPFLMLQGAVLEVEYLPSSDRNDSAQLVNEFVDVYSQPDGPTAVQVSFEMTVNTRSVSLLIYAASQMGRERSQACDAPLTRG